VKKSSLLVDTDILIHHLNRRSYRHYLEDERWQIFYSAVTKKELLAKRGLSAAERQAIFFLLEHFRLISITPTIAFRYTELRRQYPSLERNDALIAASALVRRLPLLTGNQRHFRFITGLTFLPSDLSESPRKLD
jgi:predicted nucleic acid-binding protein